MRSYIARAGILIESSELFVSDVIKQAGGNPQAIYDIVDDTAKERVVNKRQIREMRHQAGMRHLDFTPVRGRRVYHRLAYLAIGLGDTALYIMAGMAAALLSAVLSIPGSWEGELWWCGVLGVRSPRLSD